MRKISIIGSGLTGGYVAWLLQYFGLDFFSWKFLFFAFPFLVFNAMTAIKEIK
jgi:uncharacterized membrane protein (DUF4010 family)